MRTKFFFGAMILCASVMMVSCSQDESEELRVKSEEFATAQEVTLTFSPYEMEPMARQTRSATSIATLVNHLDVWIYESGSEVTDIHQTSSDADFGTVSVTLDKTKTYTLYAVGHKAEGATLANGVISFTDNKITHSMYYTTTFTPATATALSCEMTRIVGLFKLTTTDAVPEDVARMEFALGSTPTRWSVTGSGTSPTERTASFTSISRNQADGTASFFVYIIAAANEATNYTITATAYKSDNSVKQQRTFENVPIRNGYRTSYTGSFFIDTPMTMTFTVDDWQDYETVNF